MTKATPLKSIVLYADDDTDDLQLVEEAFIKYKTNVELVTVPDGVQALAYLRNLSHFDPTPCLIILDINMPRMNGKEVLVSIRNMNRFEEVPVVLFSTSSQPQDKDFATLHRAGFITKPIDIKQVDAIADTFIEHCNEEARKNIRRQFR